jgi:rhodanese-related sulfurtransferase
MKQSGRVFTITVSVVIAIVLLAFIYYAYSYAVDSPLRISFQKAKKLIQNKDIDVILDVRTDLERKTLGFYPGSIHIQSADLETRMPREFPNRSTRILAYCNSGHRARMATEKLQKLGYKNSVYIATTYLSLL